MATNTTATQNRQDPRQVANTLKKTVNWNDPGLAAGIAFEEYLPMGAFILRVFTEIVVGFNAGTTNVLNFGTNAGSFNNLATTGDTVSQTPGVKESTRGYGRSIAAASDVLPVVQFTQTGTAATAGQAVIVIEYEGGFRS